MILAQIIAGHITVIIFQKALKTADVEFINKSCDSAHFIKCEAELISHISQWNEQMVQYYLRNLTSN